MSADLYQIRVVCSHCKVELGTKPTCVAADHGRISHGLCTPCYELGMAEAERAVAAFKLRQELRARRAQQTAAA
jgi:hypothetical protein